MEPGHFLLDDLPPNRRRRRRPLQPGVVPRPGYLEQTHHARDRKIGLLRAHQLERFAFVSEASWTKKRDAFSGTPVQFQVRVLLAQTLQLGAFVLSNCGLTGVVTGLESSDPPAQRCLVDADLATGLPVLITSFTASSLYSGVKSRTRLSHDEHFLV